MADVSSIILETWYALISLVELSAESVLLFALPENSITGLLQCCATALAQASER